MPRLAAAKSASRRKRGPTILDVARRAGVSLGTVSNVLNERGNVSALRRSRVQDAIDALHYVPNGLAQSLRRQRSRVIGLCAPRSSSAHFGALLDAFEDIAADEGYEVMQVFSRQDRDIELRRVRALIARKVDGLIVIPCADPRPTFDLIAGSGIPSVIVDREFDDERFDYVTQDDFDAMGAATRALLDRGHRRLLYVLRSPGVVTTKRRMASFRAACAEVRGANGEIMVRDPSDAAFAAQFRAIMSRPDRPTAIVASNSAAALIILRVLQATGVACPDEVSLITFDAPAWAEVVDPPLSVVRPPADQIAHKAWELLMRRMRRPTHPTERVALRAMLELRDSVAPAQPAAPPGVRAAHR
ncbi:MAG TPA: LacI family DNA-binding transcriptional regulator [Casimicrobiaceae bacterium]|nr:LacI family DNA-binding transcriptional regulator [Casimicrobiaceae bacterium]